MVQNNLKKMFVVCIKNEGYAASLELRKIYEVIPDERAADHQMIRVVDESGEDYLYPIDFFISIDLPRPEEQGGGNYQTMLNEALRSYMEHQEQSLEDVIRRVVREELHAAQ